MRVNLTRKSCGHRAGAIPIFALAYTVCLWRLYVVLSRFITRNAPAILVITRKRAARKLHDFLRGHSPGEYTATVAPSFFSERTRLCCGTNFRLPGGISFIGTEQLTGIIKSNFFPRKFKGLGTCQMNFKWKYFPSV